MASVLFFLGTTLLATCNGMMFANTLRRAAPSVVRARGCSTNGKEVDGDTWLKVQNEVYFPIFINH